MVMITRSMARAEAAKSAPTVTSPHKPKNQISVPMKMKMKKIKPASSSSKARQRKHQATPMILSEASKFLLDRVENWKYKGWQGDKIDFAKPDCRTKIRNDIWSSLRLQLRGPFSVEVNYSENTPRVLNIEICEFLTETKTKLRFSDKVVATIQVTQVEDLSKVKWLYFTFRIVNREIAEDRVITVGKLHTVCSSSFDTILVRCTGQDGDLHDAMDSEAVAIQRPSTSIKKATKGKKIKKEWDVSDSKEVVSKTRALMENLPYVLQLKKSGPKKKEII